MRSCPCDRGGSTEAGEATISQNISFPGKPSSSKGGDRGVGRVSAEPIPRHRSVRRLSSQEVFSLERSVEKASYCYCYCHVCCAPLLLPVCCAPLLLPVCCAPLLLPVCCAPLLLPVCCAPLLCSMSAVLRYCSNLVRYSTDQRTTTKDIRHIKKSKELE